jgi:hypothetical protein
VDYGLASVPKGNCLITMEVILIIAKFTVAGINMEPQPVEYYILIESKSS